jgi:hypothetical protein
MCRIAASSSGTACCLNCRKKVSLRRAVSTDRLPCPLESVPSTNIAMSTMFWLTNSIIVGMDAGREPHCISRSAGHSVDSALLEGATRIELGEFREKNEVLLRIGEHPSRGRVSAKGKRHQSKDPLIIRAQDRGDAHRPTSSERLPSSATVRQAAGDAPALLLTFPRQRSCVPWDPVRQRPETPTWPISVPLTGNYGC